MLDCKIYIAFHREGKMIPNEGIYTGLHVGKSNSKLNLSMIDDASGDSISEKNEVYSELTGWYWIWKNQKHDYVGTAHYRRYFMSSPISFLRTQQNVLLYFIGLKKKRHGLLYVNDPKKWQQNILEANDIEHIMKEYDVILPVKKKFKYSVYEQYSKRHNRTDIELVRSIIQEKSPSYTEAFDSVFSSSEMYSFNMFIMPWPLFDKYMEWLFAILFDLEKKATIDLSDKYQKRLCAFMAERLQTVWMEKNKLKIKEFPVLYFKKLKTEHF
ncbi:DUF4422 domain-containing protein [Prolixibacteraceae bacterium Z1-6]|uniref:DUF4422 domain-containing protein n=1 Tax=Draconibacterium aestuarii TaxID=2998507 RepID=A0A9X3F9F0_9BACT|nr:DUF4422 domain-containing protein [Prolixibacteraceae bacterium Z1-6]